MMQQAMYNAYDMKRLVQNAMLIEDPFFYDYSKVLKSALLKCASRKTQLISLPGSFYNRLSHSLEVCKVAISLTKRVNEMLGAHRLEGVDENIIRAVSLAHDIGHPPFGHAGERVLDALMANSGGFESNAQTVKFLTLSLQSTYRTIAGVMKHKTAIPEMREKYGGLIKGYYSYMENELNPVLRIYNDDVVEKSIVDIADTISYTISDIVDLISFWGRDTFVQLVSKHYTCNELFPSVQAYFPHVGIEELKKTLSNIIDETKETIIGQLLCRDIRVRRQVQYSVLHQFIHTVDIKINTQHPRYTQLTIPFFSEMKLFLLLQLTQKCFLEREYNRKLEDKIEGYMKEVFDYLFESTSFSLPIDMNFELVRNIPNYPHSVGRARAVCDAICHLSDDEVVHLVDTHCYKKYFNVIGGK
ncbi:HD domain-containing protein [Bacillus manliponensis]|uniref:HD domain-containing protein n=1 Tax=Bacillus manliponensis TaxID=574376 RepID=UPI003513E89A